VLLSFFYPLLLRINLFFILKKPIFVFKAKILKVELFLTTQLEEDFSFKQRKNTRTMLIKGIEEALNNQILLESESSQTYLAMACWAETNGFDGTSGFMYAHSDEERGHMLKIVKYINERGSRAIIPELPQPKDDYKTLLEVFENLLEHEVAVTNSINELVFKTLEAKDYTTHNFLQWYVSEQTEEEALARSILDKLKMIGNDKGGMYLFDRDVESIQVTSAASLQAK
jgi:ferritin